MGKTKQERAQRARELLREERSETLKLAFAYMTMFGTPDLHEEDWLIDERLLLLSKSLGTVQ